MLIRKGLLTYSCFIAVRPEGERAIYGLPGAAILETPQELDRQAIREAQALHIAPTHRDVALTAIEEARRAGGFISYTPADVWWPENPTTVREIARQVDLLIVNRVEAADLTGLHRPEQAIRQLVTWGYDPVALTVGADGVWIGHNGHVEHVPALPRPGVRDTTGAGDAFTAGIVTGQLMGHALKQAAMLGVRVASLKLRESGAQAGLPSLEEALAALSK
jgi:sugar/nucleoside kinase (ribokinase family)